MSRRDSHVAVDQLISIDPEVVTLMGVDARGLSRIERHLPDDHPIILEQLPVCDFRHDLPLPDIGT